MTVVSAGEEAGGGGGDSSLCKDSDGGGDRVSELRASRLRRGEASVSLPLACGGCGLTGTLAVVVSGLQ